MRLKILLLPLLFYCVASGQGRDSALLRVHYLAESKEFADSKRVTKDWYHLDIGNGMSRFYSRYTHLSDSAQNSLKERGLSSEEIFLQTRTMPQGSNDVIIKDYRNSILLFHSKVIIQDYFYEEPLVTGGWKLTDDTLTIHGYLCYGAQKSFRGRVWNVWYSPEIPSMDGPWKFAGLPGLVLKATDSEGEFTFECAGVSLLNPKVLITTSSITDNQSAIKTDRKTYLMVKQKSVEDLRSSIISQGLTIVSVTDEKGVEGQIPKRKMNSIEEFN